MNIYVGHKTIYFIPDWRPWTYIDLLNINSVNVGSELKRGVMNVIYDSDDDDNDEEVGIGNPNSRL